MPLFAKECLEKSLMDYELAYKLQLDHLVRIAQDPAWKAWAWGYAKELAADESGVFAGIDADLAAIMNEKKIISKKD